MRLLGGPKALFFSVVFGLFLVGYLVSFGMLERFSIVVLTMCSYHFLKERKKMNIPYLSTVFIGALIGGILCSYGLYFFSYEMSLKKQSISIDKNEHTAVLLIFDGEPQRYNFPILLNNMDQKDDPFDKIWTSIKLYQYKRAYERLGISRYDDLTHEISKDLTEQLDNGYDVYISYINNQPYYKEVMNEKILKENYKRVIVSPVSLTESEDYRRIINDLEMENMYLRDTLLKFIPPLWDSDKIIKAIVKIMDEEKDEVSKKEVGVLLTGSDLYKINDPNIDHKGMNEERLFMKKMKAYLIENGYEDRKIKLTPLGSNFNEIEHMIGELQQYGVAKIFVVGMDDLLDKIGKQYKMEKLVNHIKGTEDIDITYIRGWGGKKIVVDELEYRIRIMNVEEWKK